MLQGKKQVPSTDLMTIQPVLVNKYIYAPQWLIHEGCTSCGKYVKFWQNAKEFSSLAYNGSTHLKSKNKKPL